MQELNASAQRKKLEAAPLARVNESCITFLLENRYIVHVLLACDWGGDSLFCLSCLVTSVISLRKQLIVN